MREIKFRALNKEFSGCASDWIYWRLGESPNYDLLKMETVGQFTGLHDKNGKEIWEGDIVKLVGIDITGSRIASVLFDKGSFRENYMGYSLDSYKNYEMEVLGNIHENPELLKESK